MSRYRNPCVLRAARNLSQADKAGWFNSAQQILGENFGEESSIRLSGAISTINVYAERRGNVKVNYSLLRRQLQVILPESSTKSLVASTTGLLRMSHRGIIRLAVRVELSDLVDESTRASEFLQSTDLTEYTRNKTSPHFAFGSVMAERFNQDQEQANAVKSELLGLIPPTATFEPVHFIVRHPKS